MTNPCRTCDLFQSDKNNSACLKCSKRVIYVTLLARDLGFASSRSGLDSSAPSMALNSNRLSRVSAVFEYA
jgi:hypothetical protein